MSDYECRREASIAGQPSDSDPSRMAAREAEMIADETRVADWIQLIRSEYLEIPGLNLTRCQVQRLWGLDTVTCDALLEALLDVRFLRRTHAGSYVRSDGGGGGP